MNIRDMFNPVGDGVSKVAGSISNYFSPKPDVYRAATTTPNKYILKDRGVDITDEDIQALRPLLYGELSNRDITKKQLEANVILNTAINRAREYGSRGLPNKISEVISMPNQYQAYGGNQYKLYSNPTNPLDIKKKQEVDSIVDNIHNMIKTGNYPDNTEGSYYYIHNPDQTITYDNKRKLFK